MTDAAWPPVVAALEWPPYNTLIVLAGVGLLGATAGLTGCFAVLRRRALVGDALAHAALPGICLAFLVVEWLSGGPWGLAFLNAVGVDQGRSLPALLFGAFASGVFGVALIAGLRKYTRVKEDAAVGIVLSVFFGVGVVLSRLIQNRSTLGAKAGLDSYIFGKTAGITAGEVQLIAAVAVFCCLIVVLCYKEFKLVTFDPPFARVQGWPVGTLDLALMVLVAATVVIGLPAVGVVLTAALLILPAAAARFWTDRLGLMLTLSAVFGLAVGVGGASVSAAYRLMPAGPLIVLVASVLFLASFLFAPRRGVVARWAAHRRLTRAWHERRFLAALYDRWERGEPRNLRSWNGGAKHPAAKTRRTAVD
ncbi:MAG: metal ABC transporter permease, partial [Planctomycetia bacterium]